MSTLAAKLEDLEDDTLQEALSHFNLAELDEVRKVSPRLQRACNDRKSYIHTLLTRGATVEIVSLASERGKQINHRLATVDGPIQNGRYPVKLRNITGEVETVSLKPQNLDPFLKPEREAEEKKRLDFIAYSSDAKVREGHGRLLDQVLMLLRYAVNVMNGYSFFKGEFEQFMHLSRADQRLYMANQQMYSLYRVKPSEAGFQVPGDMSILDSTIHQLADYEHMSIDAFGKMARYEKDGNGGKLVVRNMVRFMQSWDNERIHGDFWISRIARTGTLMVQKITERGETALGNVYLVRGMNSVVGSQVPTSKLPMLVRTTFLPLYDMLVYDGIMLASEMVPITPSMREKIEEHVDKSVREQTVVYCGESAARGLWDTEPPKLVKPVPSTKKSSEGEGGSGGDFPPYKPTPKQLKIATEIVKYAKILKFKATTVPGASNVLVVRRMGYRKEDNPMQMVGLLYQQKGAVDPSAIDMFPFKTWPTYTLDELLPEIHKKVKKINAVPDLVWVDEKSFVKPLRDVLGAAYDAVGFHEKVLVEWYPPPSEEEQVHHGTIF